MRRMQVLMALWQVWKITRQSKWASSMLSMVWLMLLLYRSRELIESSGLGALCAPLSATQFYKRTHWSFQYLISVSLSLAVAALLAAVFRLQTQESTNFLIQLPFESSLI